MTDSFEETEAPAPEETAPWPLRPVLLALIGLAAGYGVHLIIGADFTSAHTAWQLTKLSGLIVSAGLFGFTLERRHWWASLIFALAMGATAAGIFWWNGDPDHWGGGDGWRMFSLALALAIAAPLFQAARDADGIHFPYPSVHDHAWTNIVLWVACWVFVGIVFALAWLLAALFHLIKIDFLQELLEKMWFGRCLIGLAFGAGLGLLREHDFVVRLLQRVVATVLAVLAPVLAVGLVMFLGALPATGLAPLWAAGNSTAILLSCTVGALILANAVIGNAPDQERQFPLLKGGAMALAAVMLPLAVIAGVAIGLRINQYGFTPERLWALTFVIIACAYGLAYLAALLLGRADWAAKVRPANLGLAILLYLVALVLATPLVSFNAISTRDQVARLESGKLTPEKFDWRALAFEFGEPGRAAIERLKHSPNAAIKKQAIAAGQATDRWEVTDGGEGHATLATLEERLRLLPEGRTLPADLRALIVDHYPCGRDSGDGGKCTLFFVSEQEALLIQGGCFETPAPAPAGKPEGTVVSPAVETVCIAQSPQRYVVLGGKWVQAPPGWQLDDAARAKAGAGYRTGQIEVRKVERRQVFVGGVPVGDAF
ncbi:DUF4153 domain-containing protein [Sphingomonas sp. LB-2]|uniref:DUF4153 domain-containing protein n=1 Tax=Sphingomonas caeni TaxID=2984949 RepID=UPI00222EB340|nr:DUF4153 domain-containing protein [Sphingomonas caeni]MCW3848456.1 DUF4153 domain-containing protein [Sphingomonas caeni]